jgi:hypothetical protein
MSETSDVYRGGSVTVGLPAQLVSSGALAPSVCSRHGEPAIQRHKVLFRSYTPRWTYALLLAGVIPFFLVAAILQKRIKAPSWPFCARCSRLQTTCLVGGLGLAVLGAVMVAILTAVLPDGSRNGGLATLACIAMVLAGLGTAAHAGRASIAAGNVTQDGGTVEIRHPHPVFADQVAAARRAAPADATSP